MAGHSTKKGGTKRVTKKKKTVKKKTGRPTKYNSEFHPLLYRALLSKGLSQEEVAKELNVNRDTLHQWEKKYKKFSDAKKAKHDPNERVKAALFKRATGYDIDVEEVTEHKDGSKTIKKYKKHIPGSEVGQIFWLKNRDPKNWRDTKEVTVKDLSKTKEELRELYEKTGD